MAVPRQLSQVPDSSLDALISHIEQHRRTDNALLEPKNPSFSNWARTFGCHPDAIFYPGSEDDVRCIVELARRKGKKVRPFGAGHSPSDLVCVLQDDWLIQMDKLDKLLDVDTVNNVVTVQGGIRLRNLHPLLRLHGLALSSLGSISDQTLAGAIATATHGSSLQYGNLSSIVRSLTLITGQEDEPVLTCDAENNGDIFQASRCGLGMTGIITRVTVQCEKAFNLQEEVFSMYTSAFIEALKDGGADSIARSAQHVRAWWHPQAGQIRISRMNRTSKPSTLTRSSTSFITRIVNSIKDWIRDRAIGYHWHQIGLLIGRVFPSFLTLHARFMYNMTAKPGSILDTTPLQNLSQLDQANAIIEAGTSEKTEDIQRRSALIYPRCSPTTTRIGDSVSIFNYDCLFPQYTYEGVVPLERTAACLSEMKEWLEGEMKKTGGLRHHFPIEIRFSPADDVWMSPTHQMDGCYIGIVQYKPYGLPVTYRKLFDKFEAILFAHGGKPHWAKSHSVSPTSMRRMFPRTDDFLKIRSIVDPEGIFLNPYARRHFMGDTDAEVGAQNFKTSGQRLEETLKLD
ncbi:L-gulonolactone/D-arabinono-1,4-lactone oxidase [Cystobasidium minutum MCA 4210]|uniref:L-gulonolactone/D-arabinono-1,4-lactone oxidase n=1 Tax=Cystobasidium minutum MCA 4210 TaxID=1397322 RepID=UPI0034CE788E|eukprot:jgi/Rhomi1/89172/CE89171_753